MNRDNEENSMVTGLQFEESIKLPEPDFERDFHIEQVEHTFDDVTRLRALRLSVDDAIKAVRGSLYQGHQAE